MVKEKIHQGKLFRGSPLYYERVQGLRFGERELDFLSINMPPVCNYRCQFCLSGMNGTQEPKDSLTKGELHGLISDARSLGAFHIEVSGEGEPLVYPRVLEDIIAFAGQAGMHTTIFTNGSLITQDFLDIVVKADASLAISLDYLNPVLYERFAGRKGSFERAVKNFCLARLLFRDKRTQERGYQVFPFAVHTIVMDKNKDEIPKIREFVGDDVYFSIAPVINKGNAKEHPAIRIARKEAEALIRRYSDGSLIVSDTSARASQNAVCGTFRYGVGIRHDGEVLFDAHAYDTAGLFGNIRKTPLAVLVQKVRGAQQAYYKWFADGGFCPLRNPGFGRFVNYVRQKNE